jgi:hypothetical protein
MWSHHEMANKVYYGSNKETAINRTMENVVNEYKGTTRDNYKIYHWNYYDTARGMHISYDTMDIKGQHIYIMGSGHETERQTGSRSRWDPGDSVTWREAMLKNAQELSVCDLNEMLGVN